MSKNRLPHWEQDHATYFVTFRLADSLPADLLRRWAADKALWEEHNPIPWTDEQEREFHKRFSDARERWLDAGHGSCLLGQREVRRAVEDVLFRENENAFVWGGTIMPNHVHLLFSIANGKSLSWMMRHWKGRSSRFANLAAGTKGSLWAKDYFDRLIRDSSHFRKCARYIYRNPEKAWLPAGKYTLFESECVRRILA